MDLERFAGHEDLSSRIGRGRRWPAAMSVAALCGAAVCVGLQDATAPDAVAITGPMPASIEPISPVQTSDTLLLPYFETNLDAPPPAAPAAPVQEPPPPNDFPFLPPLPTLQLPTFFPFPPPG